VFDVHAEFAWRPRSAVVLSVIKPDNAGLIQSNDSTFGCSRKPHHPWAPYVRSSLEGEARNEIESPWLMTPENSPDAGSRLQDCRRCLVVVAQIVIGKSFIHVVSPYARVYKLCLRLRLVVLMAEAVRRFWNVSFSGLEECAEILSA
jgi:hypothetical protein